MIGLLAPLLLAAAADRQLDACMAKANTDFDYSQCGSAALHRADMRLNQRWQVLMDMMKSGYTGQDRARLIDAERAWLTYKEKACQVYWDEPSFGSMHRTIVGPACILAIVNQRIADIDTMIGVVEPQDTPKK